MKKTSSNHLSRRGQGYTEYALILALVALAAIASTEDLGHKIVEFFFGASDKVEAVVEQEPTEPPPAP